MIWKHTSRNILFVCKDKQESILHFAVVDDLVKLRTSFLQTRGVARIHHEDQTLCTGVVMSPKRTDLVLTTDIPHIELDILIGDALDVESDGGDGGHVLVAEFQFVQNC